MTKIALTMCCLFPLINILSSDAQLKKSNAPHFIIKPAQANEKMPDSLIVRYWIDENYSNVRPTFYPVKAVGSKFEFAIPVKNPITRFDIVFFYGKTQIRSRSLITEPTDNVTATFRIKDKIHNYLPVNFRGKGASKYQLIEKLGKEDDKLYLKYRTLNKMDGTGMRLLKDSVVEHSRLYTYSDKLRSLAAESDSVKLSILVGFSSKIAPKLLKFCKYEFIEGRNDYIVTAPFTLAKSLNYKKLFSDYYYSKGAYSSTNGYDNTLTKYSYWSIFLSNDNLSTQIAMKNIDREATFKNNYVYLKAIKNPEFRDRLLTGFFATPVTFQQHIIDFDSRDSCLSDAINLIKEPALNSVLTDLKLFNSGNKVYNFSFQKENGNYVNLNSFKGKVLLLEFYGWGCTGCAQFHQQFEKDIYPEFSGNPNFEVVSVSIDGSKEKWYQSMLSEKYTSKYYTNLYAGGKDKKNEMFEYYKVNAIPFILLIDEDGKLIARLHNAMSSSAISEVIRSSLVKKSLAGNLK